MNKKERIVQPIAHRQLILEEKIKDLKRGKKIEL
jgi:hypothetical protein